MNDEIMVYVPLSRYENYVRVAERVEALKAYTLEENYSISREKIAAVLGFELPSKNNHESA